jgi:hypothetical protein
MAFSGFVISKGDLPRGGEGNLALHRVVTRSSIVLKRETDGIKLGPIHGVIGQESADGDVLSQVRQAGDVSDNGSKEVGFLTCSSNSIPAGTTDSAPLVSSPTQNQNHRPAADMGSRMKTG